MATEQETPPSESVKKLAESTNHFAWDLYQNAVTKSPNENLFFSPVSIATAFGMTYIGARNDTARQMANVSVFFFYKIPSTNMIMNNN